MASLFKRSADPARALPGDEPPYGDTDDLDDGGAGKMSFLDHLDELRKRLVSAVLAVAVGVLIAFAFIEQIFGFIMRPLQQMLPAGSKLTYIEPTEAFMLYIKVAVLAGIVISAPVILWQLWLFIAPGLYAREKRLAIPFMLMSTGFFLGGALFSHYLVFPWAWKFLASFTTDYMMFQPRIQAVFALYAQMLLAMGLVFEMPTVVLFLARMNLVTGRFLLKNFKYAVLIIFIAAAVITPTGDMVTQALMAGPMLGLYVLSILIAWVVGPRKRRDAGGESS